MNKYQAPPPMDQPMQYMQPGYNQNQNSSNVVVVQQPGGSALPVGKMIIPLVGTRDWSTGLCGCFEDAESCLCGMFCPCYVQIQNAQRLHEFACLCWCVPYSDITVRNRIRSLGGIRGSICNDCVASILCQQCSICQMKRELDAMGI